MSIENPEMFLQTSFFSYKKILTFIKEFNKMLGYFDLFNRKISLV